MSGAVVVVASKFAFVPGQKVHVYAERGALFMFEMEVTQVKSFRLDGVTVEGRSYEITWVSVMNEQLYERRSDKSRVLLHRKVRVVPIVEVANGR